MWATQISPGTFGFTLSHRFVSMCLKVSFFWNPPHIIIEVIANAESLLPVVVADAGGRANLVL